MDILLFFKRVIPGLFFIYSLSFSNKHYNFINIIMWKCPTGIRTHNILIRAPIDTFLNNCIVCLKKPKINEKATVEGPSKKSDTNTFALFLKNIRKSSATGSWIVPAELMTSWETNVFKRLWAEFEGNKPEARAAKVLWRFHRAKRSPRIPTKKMKTTAPCKWCLLS